jgi:hypothetical protein
MEEPLDLSNKDENQYKDPTSLDKLQEKLYSPNARFEVKKRKPLKEKEFKVSEDWEKETDSNYLDNLSKPRVSPFVIMLIVGALFFIGALFYAGFIFVGGTQTISVDQVDVKVIGPVNIGGGEELKFDVIVQNNNQIAIETVDLIIEYPEGTKESDLRTEAQRIRIGLGNMEPNSIIKKEFAIALFGEEGENKDIKIKVEYRNQNSVAIFEKETSYQVALQSSPIRLVIDNVNKISSNQELIFDVELSSNSNQTLNNVGIKVDYPFGFTFIDSEIRPSRGNNLWIIDSLEPQEKVSFEVKGTLIGQNNEERVWRGKCGCQWLQRNRQNLAD